jgi:hypothetical protein
LAITAVQVGLAIASNLDAIAAAVAPKTLGAFTSLAGAVDAEGGVAVVLTVDVCDALYTLVSEAVLGFGRAVRAVLARAAGLEASEVCGTRQSVSAMAVVFALDAGTELEVHHRHWVGALWWGIAVLAPRLAGVRSDAHPGSIAVLAGVVCAAVAVVGAGGAADHQVPFLIAASALGDRKSVV